MQTLVERICAHCTLPVPPGLIRGDDDVQFCCAGCRAVYQQIHACGLEDYYRFRDAGELSPQPANVAGADTAAFDSPTYAELYVRDDDTHASTEFVLEGITCAACVWLVEKLPERLPGLIESRLSLADNTLGVTWDPQRLQLSRIAAELLSFGYRPHPARGVRQADIIRRELRSRLVDLGVAGALAGNLMLLAAALYAGWIGGMERPYAQLLRWLSLGLGLTALAWPGREFFRSAIASIRVRRVNFELPIAIALLTGGVAGTFNVVLGHGDIYFDSLSALIFLLLAGRLLQFCQQRRARGAVELLFALTPSTCRVIDGDVVRSIPIQALQVGDIVEVRAEELFPADGTVRLGTSAVDTSLLTGESIPVTATVGNAVFGGARNVESTLHVRVTAAGEATRVGKLMRLLERGLAVKPPIVRLTDHVAARFTVAVLIAAAITFGVWLRFGLEHAIETVVALLIVTCPCVLGLAVPLAFALSIGRLARRGILVKSAAALERLARGGRLILDKTGTLTTGRMHVTSWEGDSELQSVVADVERESTHPVGQALRRAYEHCEPPAALRGRVERIRTETGGGLVARVGGREFSVGSPRMMACAGIRLSSAIAKSAANAQCAGQTVVMVAEGSTIRAMVCLSDTPAADAASTLKHLRSRGFFPEICSGDTQGAVDRVASLVSVDRTSARGNVSPEEKLAIVKRGSGAVMIGDGVNDAAALAAADVGIAVSGGAEAALAAADVYIARPGLGGVVELVETARHTLGIVRRNVVIATSYNVLAGTLAIVGVMHPLMAAVLMPLSSVTVLSLTVLAARRGPRNLAPSAEPRRQPS